ncbi:outer membrane beta-barrel protein [Tenacibaculum sp. 190524A05c]|uniref:outer membrane beta-barrel protein n=1 Tax=Tenacibaculum platacis TaxID=3137852 RepID=UPI0032B11CA0
MKKTFLAVFALFASSAIQAQFYVSASGGYAVGANEKVLGSNVSATGVSELEGSYGEGLHTQIRGGYFFNDKIGVEVGVGYVFGLDQDISKTSGVPTLPESMVAGRGRAFGASLVGIYNFTDNIYVRAGLLTKLGGKTEATGSVNTALPVYDAAGNVIAAPAPTSIDFTTNFRGEFPIGFVGAIGYKFELSEKIWLFTELEYMNIDVTRDTSDLGSFSAVRTDGRVVTRDELTNTITVLTSPLSTLPDSTKASLTSLSYLIRDEFTWGTEGTVKPDAPYSSFGINIGIMYEF